jgi:hypothetical protein
MDGKSAKAVRGFHVRGGGDGGVGFLGEGSQRGEKGKRKMEKCWNVEH